MNNEPVEPKGLYYARLIAFFSFLSLVILPWIVLVTDMSFAQADTRTAAWIFFGMGMASGLVAMGMSGSSKRK